MSAGKENNQGIQQHRIKSFVRRTGRVTVAQKRALEKFWPRYGLDYEPSQLDLMKIFGRNAKCILEIGFGNGELLVTTASANPQTNYIGVEVHEAGVGHCLLKLHEQLLTNVRLICNDAIDVLSQQIPDHALHGVNLFFPDPWPKKRQHKRRIVRPDFIALLGRKIEAGGYFHAATDWANYAEHIDATVTADPAFSSCTTNTAKRPETKFELRGKKLGHEIWERIYTRI
ncbi:MAG: tRNA (guanosine(46)-N7)-methyltransferase TrmB [Gammaproteobacteria bacterium]|jgi:tRNA (guanine-N7-)-methyltransferase|nr:tRNA (guanosine(46)-N7)-methyltransferase TrmB [Chromatiales bacterium]MDP6674683.1 tRNA (guanosine(46)-N7)-methyltransferase TrmB [Gammaproteobacteria bacterium]